MFAKRLDELTGADIERVVAEAVPEGQEVEFKEALSARKGKSDPWYEGGDGIGAHARDELLSEIVAFANAYGGTLLLGIVESDDSPKRAADVNLVPRCADLADRLRLQARDCIEPQLPSIEVVGVPTEEDGSGVVVFRTPRSRMAPHRLVQTKDCYVRRADRCEVMTMREIQDLTLQVERGLGAVEAKFKERREAFAETFSTFSGAAEQVFAARVTLVPITPIYVDRVHGNDDVRPDYKVIWASFENQEAVRLPIPVVGQNWRPILRGTSCVDDREQLLQRRSAYCNGVIEYVAGRIAAADRFFLHPSLTATLVANGLCVAERFRRAAGAPDVEYGLELELRGRAADGVPVIGYLDEVWHDSLGTLPDEQIIFPHYPVGRSETFPEISRYIERDF